MDWKYKHFNGEATFNAARQSVLEAATAVVAESLGQIEEGADGFTARGYAAWHPCMANVRFTPAPNGTEVAVELLVQRAAMRAYMLFDVGGYYNGLIDKWFARIAQHLGGAQDEVLVSKSPSGSKVGHALLAGCPVYLIAGACLAMLAIPIDRALSGQPPGSMPGPFAVLASLVGLAAGVAVFLYVMYPDASASKWIRRRLQRTHNQEKR